MSIHIPVWAMVAAIPMIISILIAWRISASNDGPHGDFSGAILGGMMMLVLLAGVVGSIFAVIGHLL